MKKYLRSFIVFSLIFTFLFSNFYGSLSNISANEIKPENERVNEIEENIKVEEIDKSNELKDIDNVIEDDSSKDDGLDIDKVQSNEEKNLNKKNKDIENTLSDNDDIEEKIYLNYESKKILKGQTYTLDVKFSLKEEIELDLIFKSSNPNVVSVSSKGVIKGLKYGETNINITTKDGRLSTKVLIQVVPNQPFVNLKNYLSKCIKISWTKVKDTSGYRIYYKTSKSGDYKYLTYVNKNNNYFVHRKLNSFRTYYYKVVSYVKVNNKNIYSNYREKALKPVSKSYVTVMLDPGHRGKYGKDYGAKGIDGKTWEYVLNDKFTYLLAGKLKKEGYNVIYTRKPYKKSSFGSLRYLTKYVNKKKPDLLVSIHHNSSVSSKANGYAVYYSTYKKYLDRKGLYIKVYSSKYNNGRKYYKVTKIRYSKSGNPTIYFKYGKRINNIGPSRGLRYNLIDRTPCKSAVNTKKASYYVSKEIKSSRILKPFCGGMIENDFIVTSETNAPSFMLEAGFVSNKSELKKLKDSKFQDKYTTLVTKGINKYFGIKYN